MTFENGNMPTYRQFVFWVAFQSALAMSLIPLAWMAVIVILVGGFLPSLGELTAVGVHWLSVAAFGSTWFCILIYQNDRWMELHRKPESKGPQQPPRPMLRMQSAMRNHASFRTGSRQYMPLSPSHYKAVYIALSLNEWKITKRLLKDVESDDALSFVDIDKHYMDIVAHWVGLEIVDGWVKGDRHETWTLNEKGRVLFADYGHVRDSPHYPTEDD